MKVDPWRKRTGARFRLDWPPARRGLWMIERGQVLCIAKGPGDAVYLRIERYLPDGFPVVTKLEAPR